MKHSNPSVRPLLTLSALALVAGCATEGVVDAPDACRDAQGMSWNGTQANGLVINGLMTNAWNNGNELDGVEPVQGVVLDAALEARLGAGDPVTGEVVLAMGVTGSELPLTIASELPRDGLRYLQLRLDDGSNPCGAADAEALIVPGVWDLETGDRHDAMQLAGRELRHSVSCLRGVIAKCVVWGYDPATQGAEVHQTCTRMARADYCGDGVPHTENGTPIDVYDTLGIVAPEGDMEFEAGWGPDGAVCVNHPRYLDVVVGDGPSYPSCWHDLPRCEDGDTAAEHDALILNASTQEQRSWCSAQDVPGRR